MEKSNYLEEIRFWEHPPKSGTALTEEENKDIFYLENLKTPRRMTVKQGTILGPPQGTTFTAITLNRESNCTCREKNHSPIPLRYIDVTRATSATLGVMLWRRIDDSWNIEWDRGLSDAWTGFTRFTVLDEKPPVGCTWSGEAADKEANNIQAWLPVNRDSDKFVRCSATKKKTQSWLSKNRSSKMKEGWEVFTSAGAADAEFEETIYNGAEKVGSSDASSCALQDQGKKSTRRLVALLILTKQNTHASMKPTNLQESAWKDLYTKIMKTHCRKRNLFIEPLQSCAQFIPMLQAMKIPEAEAAVDKKMGKSRENTSMAIEESQKQEKGDRWCKDEGHKSSFCVTDAHLSSQEFGVGTKTSKNT